MYIYTVKHIVVRIHIFWFEFTVILFLFFTIGSTPLGAQACCPATLWDHHKSRALKKVEEEAEWERTPCLHFQSSAFLDDVRLRALAAKLEALAGQRTCSPPRRPTQESAVLPVFHSPLEVPTKSPENLLVIEKFVSGAKKTAPRQILYFHFTLDKSFLRNWCGLLFSNTPFKQAFANRHSRQLFWKLTTFFC